MIITTRRHGRDRRATTHLLAHLAKARQQSVEIAMISNTIATEPREAMRLMERARDAHARAEVAFHHVTLSPTRELSETERCEAVARVLGRLGASEHAHVVWAHKKPNEPTHFHIVLAHVGPDGGCLDDSGSFTRLEAAARSLEVQFGERLTHSRRTRQVVALLDETEPEVAAAIRAAAPSELPRSAMKSSTRAVAERLGFDLPAAKTKIRALWSQSDSPRAALAALADAGFSVEPGEKAAVFVVKSADFTVGALDRLAGRKRAEIAAAVAQALGEKERENDRERIVSVEGSSDYRKGREPRHRRQERNRGNALDRADDFGAAPAAGRRVPAFADDGVNFNRVGGSFSESRSHREEGRSTLAALTAADLVEIAQADRDPRAADLAEQALRLAQPAQSLTAADLVEFVQADRNPRAVELAARAARLAQPSPALTPTDLVEVVQADRDPEVAGLATRAARLARMLMLDRRETRARDVLAQPVELPPAPAALAPALARAKRADEAAALARVVEREAEIALDAAKARRRPGRLIGWLTGARARYDVELRCKQDVAEMRASQRQRAGVAAVIARESLRKLAQQHERAAAATRDADVHRREQARAQLRWCADARIALRDFPIIAAKNIHDAIEKVRRHRERLEELNYHYHVKRGASPR